MDMKQATESLCENWQRNQREKKLRGEEIYRTQNES